MTNDQNKAMGRIPAVCAVASLAGAMVWSPAAILVGFAVVAIVGSMGETVAAALQRYVPEREPAGLVGLERQVGSDL